MRAFIVGASGVLGRSLLPLLLQQGHAIRALVRSDTQAQAFANAGVEVAQGDLLDAAIERRLPAVIAGCDAVVHIATAIPRDSSAPGAWDANTRLRTEGTWRLLGAALEAGAARYIQQSIVMAYPDGGDSWLDESTPLDTSAARALVCAPLIAMERMVRGADPARLKWCILRGGAFVGPGTAQEGLIAQLRAGKARMPPDGRPFFSPVHVADMALAIAAALERAPPGSTFNIVDAPLRYGEYVDTLAERLGVPHPPRDSALPDLPSCRCSSRAAHEVLEWAPTHAIWPDERTWAAPAQRQ